MIKEKIAKACKDLLEKNTNINLLLKNFPESDFEVFNEELQKFLEEKEIIIKELTFFAENNKLEFEAAKKSYIKDEWEQMNLLEESNLQIIHEKKEFLALELKRTRNTAQAFSGYKTKKEIAPRIIDETE